MKRFLKKRKARGFTLVELLIVIVIIGILAGSLLLVMGSGTDKANATKIVSDMRTLKGAALMYYADEGAFTGLDLDALDDYLDRTPSTELGTYAVTSADSNYVVTFTWTGTPGFEDPLSDMAGESGITISGDVATMSIGN